MPFFESGDTEVFKAVQNKLFASTEEQIDSHTLMLDMLHSCTSVVCTYRCRVFLKNTFVWLLFFDDLCRKKKATKGTELQFLNKCFFFKFLIFLFIFFFMYKRHPPKWKSGR